MPFNKKKIAEMTATGEEFIDIGEIAKRCEVSKRHIRRVFRRYRKKLKKSQQRRGRRHVYLWADVLRCVREHLEIEKINVHTVTFKRAYTKQRVKELEEEVERYKQEVTTLKQESGWVPF